MGDNADTRGAGTAKASPVTVIGFHPVARLFPLMSDQSFRELLTDIEAHGQLTPIWLHEGQIVDGRNRYRACIELGIEPELREWDRQGDLVDFVLGLNMKRRHLTASQRAVVAFKMLPLLEAQAKERQARRSTDAAPEILPEQKADSRDLAAAMVGVSGRYVSDVKRIANEAPETLKALEAGQLTLQGAKRQLAKKGAQQGGGTTPGRARAEAMKLASAAIARLSRIESGDPQALAAMERVRVYVGSRIPEITSKNSVADAETAGEKQLLLFKER